MDKGTVTGPAARQSSGDATIGRVFREESGRSVATLIRVFGQIDIAEDAVQDAFAWRCTSGRRTACHRTRVAGSPRRRGDARSTGCAETSEAASCSGTSRRSTSRTDTGNGGGGTGA